MKKLFLFLIVNLILTPFYSGAQNEIELQGEVDDVTVFLRGAQITRNVNASLKAGENILRLSGLTAQLDAGSIQVSAKGDFTILGVKHSINYLKDQKLSPEIEMKKDSLEDLQFKLQMRRSLREVYKEEKNLVVSNRTIKGQDATLLAEDLLEMADFFRDRLKEIEFSILELNQEEQELQETINRLNRDLANLNAKWNKNSSEIEVRVQSPKSQTGKFELSYQVNNAGWLPSYDIRAKDINGTVELVYKAKVYQSTGNDWERVNLTLSTGNPAVGGQPPVLYPWYLQMYDPEVYRNNNQSRKREAYNQPMMIQDAAVEMDEAEVAAGFLSEQVTSVEALVNTEFQVGVPYSIPSDNKRYDVEVLRPSLNAEYKYFAAPKQDKDAFLLAKVTDWAQYNLIAGQSNIYYQGTYVGKAYIDPAINQDTLDLSLGRDKSVVLSREQIKDFCKTTVFGGKKTTTKAFSIKVTNNKSKSIAINVQDQIPLTNTGEISVEAEELSGGVYDATTGFVDWELNLAAGETKELVLKYVVKYPKKKIISNL